MAITPFMNLDLPTVSVTLGPAWATQLNTAMGVLDEHDHSPGKGKQIVAASLNINDDLSLNEFSLQDVFSLDVIDQDDVLSGPLRIYAKDGDFWFNNSSGVPVQITSGGSVITTPSTVQALDYISVITDTTIGSADTTVFVSVDMSAERTITLPLASAVAEGRMYVIKDATNESETNTLHIAAAGSDTFDNGETTLDINSDGASVVLIGNGVDAWEVW